MAPNDLGYPGRTKRVVNLRSIVKTQTSTNNINIEAVRDGGLLLGKTGTLSLGTNLKWNQSGIAYNDGSTFWPGGTTESLNLFTNRTCETIAPRWNGSGTVGLVGYQCEFVLEEN